MKKIHPLLPATKNVAMGEGQTFYLDLAADHFVHFTTASRAELIVQSHKILQRPPYKKFGGDAVYGVSTVFGQSRPGVQMTHTVGTKEDPIVALVFKTNTLPKVGFVEEVVWDADVSLQGAKVVGHGEGMGLIRQSPVQLTGDDLVMYSPAFKPSYGRPWHHQGSARPTPHRVAARFLHASRCTAAPMVKRKDTDWTAFREAPQKILGMKRAEALAFLEENAFPGAIASEDGKSHILPAIVMIRLNVQNGVVIGTDLDMQQYGTF